MEVSTHVKLKLSELTWTMCFCQMKGNNIWGWSCQVKKLRNKYLLWSFRHTTLSLLSGKKLETGRSFRDFELSTGNSTLDLVFRVTLSLPLVFEEHGLNERARFCLKFGLQA